MGLHNDFTNLASLQSAVSAIEDALLERLGIDKRRKPCLVLRLANDWSYRPDRDDSAVSYGSLRVWYGNDGGSVHTNGPPVDAGDGVVIVDAFEDHEFTVFVLTAQRRLTDEEGARRGEAERTRLNALVNNLAAAEEGCPGASDRAARLRALADDIAAEMDDE